MKKKKGKVRLAARLLEMVVINYAAAALLIHYDDAFDAT